MPPEDEYDAVVVGSGPNGFSAALTLQEAGLSVLVIEANPTLGGGCRTEEVTFPGFRHDICSAIHPMAVISPFFRKLNLEREGLMWIQPEVPLAHPLLHKEAVILQRSIESTSEQLGLDRHAWKNLFEPFVNHSPQLFDEILKPVHFPKHPLLVARFGWYGFQSCEGLIQRFFTTPEARALFAGSAAHAMHPLNARGTAAFGLVLTLAGHSVGWPCVQGGSFQIIKAMEKRFTSRGGHVRTSWPVRSLSELPKSRAVLFDLTPRQLLAIGGEALTSNYRRRLRSFRYGPGVFKIDWALRGPIPWSDPHCAQAATVHVGGTAQEIAHSERQIVIGSVPEKPFVLVAQPSLFDPTRAPAGQHTGWAYCHVPHGSVFDMTTRIENQVERFAPGFRDQILARRTMNCSEVERHNANMIGGDIGGGSNDLRQVLFRPFLKWNPYATSNDRFFLCSSSTPPGGGVHGMCGYWAARTALQRVFEWDACPWE